MGKPQGIRVFLRIRPPPTAQQSRLLAQPGPSPTSGTSSSLQQQTFNFRVEHDFTESILHIHAPERMVRAELQPNGTAATTSSVSAAPVDDVVNNTVVDFQYKFQRVLDSTVSQETVFNLVAKDCVASVLDGYNSTVFAYGQTGSGKTYSITGGTESYDDRGVIPRAMAMIYDEIAKRRSGGDGGDGSGTTYSVSMSYLQIYNDRGQDLLNHGRDAKTLEDLPPVTIHEMEEDVMLKGLEQHSAPTLADALNLLFLGDTNRLYCETPMNKTSSRSHCIFTIYIEARPNGVASSTVRRSKLNLVDLAGSERVSKTGVSGTILTEAKHINLSLHYLQQVIVALSEKSRGVRDHVPYRNSFLTMVLRDSLGQNCKTAMLATAHVVSSQLQETLSTCQFAQRVALIQQDPHVNVETDPVLMVRKLKAEVAQLKDENSFLRQRLGEGEGGDGDGQRELNEDEKTICNTIVTTYVEKASVDGDYNSKITGFGGDLARIYYCFEVMRGLLLKTGNTSSALLRLANGSSPQQSSGAARSSSASPPPNAPETEKLQDEVAALRVSLQQKENEINTFLTLLHKSSMTAPSFNAASQIAASPLWFGASHDDAAEDAQSRLEVLQDALRLLQNLRARGSSGRGGGSGMASGAAGTPASSWMNGSALLVGGAMSAQRGERAGAMDAKVALDRVTTLAQSGALNNAEAAAVTAYLERKQQLQQQQIEPDEDAADGNGNEVGSGERIITDALTDAELVQDRALAFDRFKESYQNHAKVDATKTKLRESYEICKNLAQELNGKVDAIKQMKRQIQCRRAERAADGIDVADAEEDGWLAQLRETKEEYNGIAASLRQHKEEIDAMHAFMKSSQDQLTRDFDVWLTARQKQVQLALRQQQQQYGDAQMQEKVRGALRTEPPVIAAAPSSPTPPPTSASGTRASSHPSSAPTGSTTSMVGASLTGVSRHLAPPPSLNLASQLTASASAPSSSRGAELKSSSTAAAKAPPLHAASSPQNLLFSADSGRSPALSNSQHSPSPARRLDALPLPQQDSLGGGAANTPKVVLTPGAAPTLSSTFHHLRPLGGPPTSSFSSPVSGSPPPPAPVSSTSVTTSRESASNPFFTQARSTGDAAADAQLAALYKAREEMRRQMQ